MLRGREHRREVRITTAIVVTSVLVVVIGIPFTLWWWRIADRWADAERKRFKPKVDRRERVTVRTPAPDDGHDAEAAR